MLSSLKWWRLQPFAAGVCGVAIPLLGKKRRFLRTDSNLFVAAKAFAAGVILATGFVHMLPDATSSLTSPCLPGMPWSRFPFSGFIAMMAALATLLANFIGTQYYARKQERQSPIVARTDLLDAVSESGINQVEPRGWNSKVFGEEEGGAMHIVGMHAHAAYHRQSLTRRRGLVKGAFQSIHTVILTHMGLETEKMTRALDTLLFHRFWNLGLCHIL